MGQVIILLLVLGIVAVVLEMLAPGYDGFLFGIAGIIALIVAAVLTIIHVPHGWIYVAASAAVIGVSGKFMYAYIKRRQQYGSFIMNDTLAEGAPLIGDINGLIGKEGTTVTILRPYGEVDFNGFRIQVTSDGPLLERGVRVRVAEVQQGNRIIVNAIDGN